jgi:hypothetical protein
MLEQFDFELDRMNSIIGIMGVVASFRPDDRSVADVVAMRDAALLVRNTNPSITQSMEPKLDGGEARFTAPLA